MLFLVLMLVMGITVISCGNTETTPAPVNEDVISYRDFSLSAASVNLKTMTEGTIFIRGNREKAGERRVQISVWVEIDPEDWGGISFNIPQGWEVSEVTSDYPQGNPHPESYTMTLQNAGADQKYSRIVEIGSTRHGAAQPQGGTGSVIIELVPASGNKDIGDNMEILIALGSSEGYILGPVYQVVQVSLN